MKDRSDDPSHHEWTLLPRNTVEDVYTYTQHFSLFEISFLLLILSHHSCNLLLFLLNKVITIFFFKCILKQWKRKEKIYNRDYHKLQWNKKCVNIYENSCGLSLNNLPWIPQTLKKLQNLHHCAELLFVRWKFICRTRAEYITFYCRISKILLQNF